MVFQEHGLQDILPNPDWWYASAGPRSRLPLCRVLQLAPSKPPRIGSFKMISPPLVLGQLQVSQVLRKLDPLATHTFLAR